jgi:hypothetical protein
MERILKAFHHNLSISIYTLTVAGGSDASHRSMTFPRVAARPC